MGTSLKVDSKMSPPGGSTFCNAFRGSVTCPIETRGCCTYAAKSFLQKNQRAICLPFHLLGKVTTLNIESPLPAPSLSSTSLVLFMSPLASMVMAMVPKRRSMGETLIVLVMAGSMNHWRGGNAGQAFYLDSHSNKAVAPTHVVYLHHLPILVSSALLLENMVQKRCFGP